MFTAPSFTFWNIMYTAIGASVFWSMWGRAKLKVWGLSELVENLLPWHEWHPLIEFVIFIALGVFVGIGVTNPTNPAQAISAGLGWTGAVARRKM